MCDLADREYISEIEVFNHSPSTVHLPSFDTSTSRIKIVPKRLQQYTEDAVVLHTVSAPPITLHNLSVELVGVDGDLAMRRVVDAEVLERDFRQMEFLQGLEERELVCIAVLGNIKFMVLVRKPDAGKVLFDLGPGVYGDLDGHDNNITRDTCF
jgi:hypothetical protein